MVDQWEILPDEVTCLRKIGHGQFGEVHIAEMVPPDSTHKGKKRSRKRKKEKRHQRITAAVKMLCGRPGTYGLNFLVICILLNALIC